ncbi:hypothetical protein Y1Q_0006556 [Alligator mississippiensis]|uniref:Uncharacterized protein n=1 Tax=Alligator mississippiensis TaxID=8496 RepID=A0A151NTN8_ALLMI|nr:hypothetical protein Y1Q_0006556 [Alligator mississippiensis]
MGKRKWEDVEIDTTAFSGNYCLSAQTSFKVTDLKHRLNWKLLLAIVVPLFFLLLLLPASAFSINCLCKDVSKSMKRPQALVFFSYLMPLPLVFEKKPNEEEFFMEELIIPTLKLELQKRRNNPLAKNNASPAASLLSLLEEKHDSSFRPYIEMPRFPKRDPNCHVWRESERVGVQL